MKEFTLQTPATSANLGAGFDALGLALRFYNRFHFKLDERMTEFSFEFKNQELVSEDYDHNPNNNLLLKSFRFACEHLNLKPPFLTVICDNQIPDSSGLGSSTTAVCAGIAAAFILAGREINHAIKLQILKLAFNFESHPDNLTPCLFGGFCVGVMNESKDDVIFSRFELNYANLKAFLLMPKQVRTSTNHSRSRLNPTVTMDSAIFNLSRTALFTSSIMKGDFDKLKIAMQDAIHQDLRLNQSGQKSNFDRLLQLLNQSSDFYGMSVSGSGPSLLILGTPELKIDAYVQQVYPNGTFLYDTTFDNQGLISYRNGSKLPN